MQQTRQGVRDLNGPRLNGSGYNGNRAASCAHHRAPDLTPKHVEVRVTLDADGYPIVKHMTCCSSCGVDLYAQGAG